MTVNRTRKLIARKTFVKHRVYGRRHSKEMLPKWKHRLVRVKRAKKMWQDIRWYVLYQRARKREYKREIEGKRNCIFSPDQLDPGKYSMLDEQHVPEPEIIFDRKKQRASVPGIYCLGEVELGSVTESSTSGDDEDASEPESFRASDSGFSFEYDQYTLDPENYSCREEDQGTVYDEETIDLCLQFAFIGNYKESNDFLCRYPFLACQTTVDYLIGWCITSQLTDSLLIGRLAHQAVTIRYMLLWRSSLEMSSVEFIDKFFNIINRCTDRFREKFKHTIRKLVEYIVIRVRLEHENQGQSKIDPLIILDKLPLDLRYAFVRQDLSHLYKSLEKLDPERALKCMRMCIQSGLWRPNMELDSGFEDLPDDCKFKSIKIRYKHNVISDEQIIEIFKSPTLYSYYFEGHERIKAKSALSEKFTFDQIFDDRKRDKMYSHAFVPCGHLQKTKTIFELALHCHHENPILFGPIAFIFDIFDYYQLE